MEAPGEQEQSEEHRETAAPARRATPTQARGREDAATPPVRTTTPVRRRGTLPLPPTRRETESEMSGAVSGLLGILQSHQTLITRQLQDEDRGHIMEQYKSHITSLQCELDAVHGHYRDELKMMHEMHRGEIDQLRAQHHQSVGQLQNMMQQMHQQKFFAQREILLACQLETDVICHKAMSKGSSPSASAGPRYRVTQAGCRASSSWFLTLVIITAARRDRSAHARFSTAKPRMRRPVTPAAMMMRSDRHDDTMRQEPGRASPTPGLGDAGNEGASGG
ncbi:uncharacterized protein [Hyperolius riggenbachi]|uniref:uncharacterized protein n=1 Tax=Hyperolius riggenbachi TaxID=752182 RepID=UPI0035A37D3B